MEERTVRPGRHAPLGATFDGHGVNFAVYSESATGMELWSVLRHPRAFLRSIVMNV